jgi:hypothetical protein
MVTMVSGRHGHHGLWTPACRSMHHRTLFLIASLTAAWGLYIFHMIPITLVIMGCVFAKIIDSYLFERDREILCTAHRPRIAPRSASMYALCYVVLCMTMY